MNRLDTYYRALLEYREAVGEERACKLENKAIAGADTKNDRIFLERKSCTIDRTWVDEIEKGLVFVEKAIKEERQFIRSNGEVVPIEKVKNVSKGSVEHLARHSNLITRVREGEDIIPDHLYTVEKLNDYAVYENRFLYMLLCYLRDFISLRYNKILDISNTYDGKMSMNKFVKQGNQTIKYKVELEQTRRDDEYLKEHNSEQGTIDRIDLLLKTVLAFLATPLMEIVSKAPMLKPPITKTNVLKMNNNFKGAMALYGFVTAYEGDGFTVSVEKREITPFEDLLADEMAVDVSLAAFVTYKHALGIEAELKREYLLEEQRRRDEEFKKHGERLEELRRKLKNGNITPEEYIASLEDRIKALDKKATELVRTQARLEKTERALAETKENLEAALKREAALISELAAANAELERQKQKYIEDMAAQKAEYEGRISEIEAAHEAEINAMTEAHAEELSAMRAEHEGKIAELIEANEKETEALKLQHKEMTEALVHQHTEEIDALKGAHAEELDGINSAYSSMVAERDGMINELNEKSERDKKEHQAELDEHKRQATSAIEQLRGLLKLAEDSNSELIERSRVSEAKLLGIKAEINAVEVEESFITEDEFDELERTYNAFKRFYKEEWKRAKKKIRNDLLRAKREKQDGSEEEE